MFHTNDDFLNAIAAEPNERTLRLVYADWLTEHDDPRAELIRVEEEMRQVPVFADRFWELKPRRNALRTVAGAEWCGHMRYGTECEPVFRHGIPDGWAARWRLIREFTERWHRVPMSDVGGRQAEIAEAETRLGRVLPPSVREWIACERDSRQSEWGFRFWFGTFEITPIPGKAAVSLLATNPGDYYGVRDAETQEDDPPVDRYIWAGEGDRINYEPAGDEFRDLSVTGFAFRWVLMDYFGEYRRFWRDHLTDIGDQDRLLNAVENHFSTFTRWDDLNLYETDNILVALWDRGREQGLTVFAWIAAHLPEEIFPSFLRELIHRNDRDDGSIPF